MRTGEDMLKLILDVAENDDRIRAVTMEGSRASKNATHDEYCDFDISYVVNVSASLPKTTSGLKSLERFQSIFPNGTYEDIWNKYW